MTLREIIKKWLEENGYDGLCGDHCGCGTSDLFPCGEGINMDICEPGYRVLCDDDCPDKEECPEPNTGMFCITTKKEKP